MLSLTVRLLCESSVLNRNFSKPFVKWIIAYGGIRRRFTTITFSNEYSFWGGQQERRGHAEGYIDLFSIYLFIYLFIAFSNFLNTIPNYNQQDTTFLDLFISTEALHISGDSSSHHQEHITVHTASGTVNQYCC